MTRLTIEGCKSVDARSWHRQGLLRAGQCLLHSDLEVRMVLRFRRTVDAVPTMKPLFRAAARRCCVAGPGRAQRLSEAGSSGGQGVFPAMLQVRALVAGH
jgi:hypothetical protein